MPDTDFFSWNWICLIQNNQMLKDAGWCTVLGIIWYTGVGHFIQATRVLYTILVIMAILTSEALLCEKNSVTKYYHQWGLNPVPLILSLTLSFSD